jgi:tetratricopeptide (TPR) repeat protein
MTRISGIPLSLQVLFTRAEECATRLDWDGAIAAYDKALMEAPDDPYTLVQLSYMHSLRGSYRRAQEYALAGAATRTKNPAVLAELLPRLRTFNQIPMMLSCIERARSSGLPASVLVTAAAQLSYVNLPDRAIRLLDQASRTNANDPSILLARAQTSIYLGRFPDADRDAERALAIAPHIAQGYWLQAWARRQTPERNHVDALKRELGRQGRTADDVALLSFALHKECDDLERYEEAGSALVLGCRAQRSLLSYSTQESRQLFEALSAFEPDGESQGSSSDPVPIFIVGMHRSGTTLLETMLDGSPDVKALGELYDFTSAMRYATDHHCKGVIDDAIVQRGRNTDLALAGQQYLEGVAWRLSGERCFTDKLPSNFLNIGFIARALPHAKILHMVRDPLETCFSNLRELYSDSNPYSYDPTELADYYLLYRGLMQHWHRRFPGRILDVEYSKLITEPEMQLRRVSQFCGLPFDPAMLDLASRQRAIVTASAVQVRDRIEVRERPKWAPYERLLAPLIRRLDP